MTGAVARFGGLEMRLLTIAIVALTLGACTETEAPGEAATQPPPSAEELPAPVTSPPGPNLAPVDEKRAQQPMHNRGENLRGLYLMNIRDARLDPVITGLSRPWAFEFLDAETLLITETGGRLYRLGLSPRTLTPISGLPEIATGASQTGLFDVEIHPEFAQNQRIYFSYSEADPETQRFYRTVIATALLRNDRLEDLKPLVIAEPWGFSPSNFGGALAFDDQGYLFISVGDRSEGSTAQRGDRLQGKILRLHDDGRIPEDNPFIEDDRFDDRIWALGVRNPQGLHFDAPSGLLFETEHGPMGGDEVNIIDAGANYGWPQITYGMNYTFEAIGTGSHANGLRQPIWYYLPSTATSPLTVYRGDMFPEWEGDLLVGALKDKSISRLSRDGQVIRSEFRFLRTLSSRIRDLKVAHDGSLWVLTEFGSLFRLWREGLADEPVGDAITGEGIYDYVCASCHESGAYDAPRPGRNARWSAIAAQPRGETVSHVIDGIGAMPERGLCGFCTDEQLQQAVDFMFEAGSKNAE